MNLQTIGDVNNSQLNQVNNNHQNQTTEQNKVQGKTNYSRSNFRGVVTPLKIIICLIFVFTTISNIVCLCRIFPTSSQPNFDYLGFIIGILSFLVTILIGWQIYQVIEIKSQIQAIRDRTNKMQEETMARAYTSIMNQTSYIVEGRKDNDDCYNAISNALFACKHFHLAGKKEDGDKLLSMIAKFKIENCTLNRDQINNLRIILGQLSCFDIDTVSVNEWLNNYEKVKQ